MILMVIRIMCNQIRVDIRYCAVLYCTAKYSIAQYSTVKDELDVITSLGVGELLYWSAIKVKGNRTFLAEIYRIPIYF